jgi:hypothetical protein
MLVKDPNVEVFAPIAMQARCKNPMHVGVAAGKQPGDRFA